MRNTTSSKIIKELDGIELQLKFFEVSEAWLKKIKYACAFLKNIVIGNYAEKIRNRAGALLYRYILIWDENY